MTHQQDNLSIFVLSKHFTDTVSRVQKSFWQFVKEEFPNNKINIREKSLYNIDFLEEVTRTLKDHIKNYSAIPDNVLMSLLQEALDITNDELYENYLAYVNSKENSLDKSIIFTKIPEEIYYSDPSKCLDVWLHHTNSLISIYNILL